MKVTQVCLVTALCVAVAMASGYGTNINNYANGQRDQSRSIFRDTNHGQNSGKVDQRLRDLHHFDGARNRLASNGNDYKGRASQAGSSNAKNAASGNKAEQNYAKQDAKFDEVASQIAQAAHNRGYQSAAHGKYDKLDNNRARGYNANAANKKAYHKGKVFNDNVKYGFDKKYNQNLSERGGFEEQNNHNAHKLDEYKDKQKARKLIRGDHSAANARQDAQHALKESKYNQNANQKQAANGKFANNDKKLNKAGATQDAQAVLYDRKDNRFHAENNGNQQAIKKKNEYANKDNKFGRHAAASHAGAQGHADKEYYGGHGNDGSGVHGGSGGSGYGNSGPSYKSGGVSGVSGTGSHSQGSAGGANHKYGENAKQSDRGNEHLAQAAGANDAALKQYKQAQNKGEFAQLKSFLDNRKGKFAQGVHNAENNGYHSKDAHAAKSASGADRKFADAAAQSKAKAAKHDLDEAAFDKSNFKRNQQDRNENFKKLKRFYHDKKAGGNNFERLNYNRKRVENEFGETQAAQKENQNQFDKAHKAAKHNAAARKDTFLDAKKASNGFNHHNANRNSDGHASNRANAFSNAAAKSHGNKKEISEADYAKNQDVLAKKQQDHTDNSQGKAQVTNNGFKNTAAEDSHRTGNGGAVGNNLLRGDTQRRVARPDFNADVSRVRVDDIHNTFPQFRKPSNRRPQINQFGSVGGKNFGRFGDTHGRSIGGIASSSFKGGHDQQSGYGNFGSGSSGFQGGRSFGHFGLNKAPSFGRSRFGSSSRRSGFSPLSFGSRSFGSGVFGNKFGFSH